MDGEGNIVAMGTFAGAVDFGRGILRGSGDGFAAGFDAAGAALWSTRLEGWTGVPAIDARGTLVTAGSVEIAGDGGISREARVATVEPRPGREGPRVDEPDQPRERKVARSLPLDRATSGVAGRLELLLDSRMTEDDIDAGCFFWWPGSGLGPRFDSPPLNAALAVVDEAGNVLDTMLLDHPAARVEVWKLHGGDQPTYATGVNDGICAGPYRGWVTELVEVGDGRLRGLRAATVGSHYDFPIGMVTSLRGAHRTAPARRGKGKDVLYARVHDSPGGDGSVTFFTRYAFEGGRWVEHERQVPGWRELDGDERFPAASEFP